MEEALGLQLSDKSINDWVAGDYSPLGSKFINPSGVWLTPEVETQNRWGFDRLACVTYSCLNCIESLYYYKTGVWRNFSDRFLAKASGTNRLGNSVANVFDTARKTGLVDESIYPDVQGGWEEYYKEIPLEIINTAKDFLAGWSLYREWIRTDNRDAIFNALKEAPLQVVVAYASGNGYLNPTGKYNHAVMCYGAEYGKCWYIFDHYTQSTKTYAWEYEFDCVLKPSLIKKENKPMTTLIDNMLVQLVQGQGGFGLYLDGKMIVDELDKVLASWIVRTKGKTDGMVSTMTLEEWEKIPKVNLKGVAV
jgi:hypothetical protein